jgi:exopolyphosphatase/guanosine-5'-triphosphate,3'-diphosphate pyrophosphatase
VRVAIVDIGTNSTRLLVADVDRGGHARQLVRTSRVTRLGDGVDASGQLAETAVERTFAVLASYQRTIEEQRCEANLAVLTSAVRDAHNGAWFASEVRDRFALNAMTLSGDEEARLTFAGAMSGHARPAGASEGPRGATAVIDIGGGSTEIVIGRDLEPCFHVSVQAGVVRMSERHIRSDPPTDPELDRLALDARAVFREGLAAAPLVAVQDGVAVAGTATSAAAIAQALDPYDPARVHRYRLGLDTVQALLGRLALLDEAQRRRVTGLHPDRAPTIVAGMVLLREAITALRLDQVEVSEHDLLLGAALHIARIPSDAAPLQGDPA